MTATSVQTVKRLFALSQNHCASPDCTTPIVHNSGAIVGDVCHIKAENPGGPRYDQTQTDAERHGFRNLILLCKIHHTIIDHDTSTYTVDHLTEMKKHHEQNGSNELTPETARMAERLYAAMNITVAAGRDAQVMVDSPGSIQANGPYIVTEKLPELSPISPPASTTIATTAPTVSAAV